MSKIIQSGKTISADFSTIENMYQQDTFDIEVELIDDTFNGYITMLSVCNPQYDDNVYTLPIINNKVTLPYYTTNKLGVMTISLFGFKGSQVITTNKLEFTVAASNPTNIKKVPGYVDWNTTMQSYVDAQIQQTKTEITPSIDPTTHNWLIGGVDTGVDARGENVQEDLEELEQKIPSPSITVTIQPSDWVNGQYTISDSRITMNPESHQEFLPPDWKKDVNDDVIEAIQAANIRSVSQSNGQAVIACMGDVPTIAIQLKIIFRGVK